MSILLLVRLMKIRFAHKSKLSLVVGSCIKVSVPINFRLQGRNTKSKCRKRGVLTSLKQICVLKTSLKKIKIADNFDTSTTCILDNCANTHIWNCKDDFLPGSMKSIDQLSNVSTIGGSNFYPDSTGQLPVTWKDDKGKSYSIVLDDVLYFPHSPVNI